MDELKRLSIAQCKRILEADGRSYSDEQIMIIRQLLYNFAELDYLIFTEMDKSILKSEFNSDSASEAKKAA